MDYSSELWERKRKELWYYLKNPDHIIDLGKLVTIEEKLHLHLNTTRELMKYLRVSIKKATEDQKNNILAIIRVFGLSSACSDGDYQ